MHAAIVAIVAPPNVEYQASVAGLKARDVRADRDNLSSRLMSRYSAKVALMIASPS